MQISIQIGYGVWVGHDCFVSKGVKLADNVIVVSGSVVKGIFKEPNSIIGGNLVGLIDSGFIRDDIWQLCFSSKKESLRGSYKMLKAICCMANRKLLL